MLPDVPAIDKEFDYLVPEGMADHVRPGTMVRVQLHGRRVGGWVVADDVSAPAGVALRPLAKVTGWGPAPELLELAVWAAWRWSGRRAHLLRTASPLRAVRGLPSLDRGALPSGAGAGADELTAEALSLPRSVLRLPPAADVFPLVVEAARQGTTLVVAPSTVVAADLARRLRDAGVSSALVPGEWAAAAAGARVVVGARAAAWAPAVDLAAVVVVDEHDEAHQEESQPTWNARDVAAERARRAGARCGWVSPCPTLEALAWAPQLVPSRSAERAGWPVVEVVDRRKEEPLRADLYSPRLVELVRATAAGGTGAGPAVCVLNRKGRAAMLACRACGDLARCPCCGAVVAAGDEEAVLVCRRCDAIRPSSCLSCGAGRLKLLRPGVSRVREDLERLASTPVEEITGDRDTGGGTDGRVLVGTEAVLHRSRSAGVVAFLDLDAELLAPRYRAAEHAMALVARAARLLGGKAERGRLVLQTRLPRHEVVEAALHADPGRVAAAEAERREALRFPPTTALAVVSGAPAAAFVEQVRSQPGVEVLGPADGFWLVRAPDHRRLCDALAAVPRPPGRLRVAVDPPRI